MRICSSPSGSCKQLNIYQLYRFFYVGQANQKRQGNQLSFLSFARSIVGFSFFVSWLWVGFPFFVPCCGFRSLSLRSFVSFASLSRSVLGLRPPLRRKTTPTPFTAKLDIELQNCVSQLNIKCNYYSTTPVQLHYNSTIIPIKTLKTCIFKIIMYICKRYDKVIDQN